MTDKLDTLDKEWSLIDGQGLVRVFPTDRYRTGFVLIATVGPLAEKHDYYPDILLSRDQVTVTIDDENEEIAYRLAAEIDAALDAATPTEPGTES